MPLELTPLLSLIEEMSAYRQLAAELKQQNGSTKTVVLESAQPYLIASLHYHLPRPILVVTAQPEKSKRLYEQLLAWRAPGLVQLFPEGTLPYQPMASDTATEQERLQVLSALAGQTGLLQNRLKAFLNYP